MLTIAILDSSAGWFKKFLLIERSITRNLIQVYSWIRGPQCFSWNWEIYLRFLNMKELQIKTYITAKNEIILLYRFVQLAQSLLWTIILSQIILHRFDNFIKILNQNKNFYCIRIRIIGIFFGNLSGNFVIFHISIISSHYQLRKFLVLFLLLA